MSKLDFEKPIIELENKINDIRKMSSKKVTLEPEIKRLETKLEKLKNDIYNNLSAWQRVQIARHPGRPYTLDYIKMMTGDFFLVNALAEGSDCPTPDASLYIGLY